MSAVGPLFRVYLALVTLLALTAGLDFLPLGPFNLVLAIAIAIAKAVLIGLFFMELRTERRLVWLFAGTGLFWLGILFSLSLSDYFTRGWLPWGSRFGP